jgi:hypothetical protein
VQRPGLSASARGSYGDDLSNLMTGSGTIIATSARFFRFLNARKAGDDFKPRGSICHELSAEVYEGLIVMVMGAHWLRDFDEKYYSDLEAAFSETSAAWCGKVRLFTSTR